MMLKESAKLANTTQSSSHTNATAMLSSQTNTSPSSLHHSQLHTSAKIAGVILFVVLAALIIVSAQASGKQANDEFNEANKGAVGASIELNASAKTVASTDEKTGEESKQDGGNSVSASISNGSVEVSIDGKPVDVPNGSNYSQTTTSDNGTTSINISNNTSTTGSANNGFSYTSTIMSTNSSSSSNGGSTSNVYTYTSP